MKRLLLSSIAVCAMAIPAQAADCPAITVADMGGVAAGAFPAQYEKAEFEAAAGCTMTFNENPSIADFNSRIQGAVDPLLTVGGSVNAQWRVRDPLDASGFTDALSDGIEFTILP